MEQKNDKEDKLGFSEKMVTLNQIITPGLDPGEIVKDQLYKFEVPEDVSCGTSGTLVQSYHVIKVIVDSEDYFFKCENWKDPTVFAE